MKNLSLLQSLADQPVQKPKAPEPVVEAVEPAATQYQVYIIENADGTKLEFGIPLDRVAEFDAFVEETPETLATITDHLERFSAVVPE
jgi:hypothetical protein